MKKIFSIVILSIFTISVFLFTNLSLAKENETREGLETTKGIAYESTPNVPTDIPTAIGKVVGAALALVGVLFFILMIYGGILWMTARGNDQQIEKAKDLIVAAIIGLVIVLSAYAVTAYIGGALTT